MEKTQLLRDLQVRTNLDFWRDAYPGQAADIMVSGKDMAGLKAFLESNNIEHSVMVENVQSLIEEISAVYDIKTLEQMYQMATDEPYSFWYILFTAKRREDMFYLRFEQKMLPSTQPPSGGDAPREVNGRTGDGILRRS